MVASILLIGYLVGGFFFGVYTLVAAIKEVATWDVKLLCAVIAGTCWPIILAVFVFQMVVGKSEVSR